MAKYLIPFLVCLICCRASDEFKQFLSNARKADSAILSWNDEKVAQLYGLSPICAQLDRPNDLHSLFANLVQDQYEYAVSGTDKDGLAWIRKFYCPHEHHYTHRLTFYIKDKEVARMQLALDGRDDALLLTTNLKVQITRGSCLYLIEIAGFNADLEIIKKKEAEFASKRAESSGEASTDAKIDAIGKFSGAPHH